MFRNFMEWLSNLIKTWTKPWDRTQELEFKEWAYRRGLNIKTDLKN